MLCNSICDIVLNAHYKTGKLPINSDLKGSNQNKQELSSCRQVQKHSQISILVCCADTNIIHVVAGNTLEAFIHLIKDEILFSSWNRLDTQF